jgi:hypothetical protein
MIVLLVPAGKSVEDSEDAKLLLKCCCSSDIDPTGGWQLHGRHYELAQ